ncbi:LPS-assembly protein LptD [Aurantiacibacter aquimixticola]|uniref:LPS-assembly protein LptD n=1 Tax=Aurantiacibacter aquimixticola TaxID=1958945 RepID=A0A419RQT6_9SPHN|nr:LPS assembly protein LptD [Aurantiacibacter aquimixticola]RJY08141.1 LPS-assembly protein LptD [Aurantiacibacter aquimixticola]
MSSFAALSLTCLTSPALAQNGEAPGVLTAQELAQDEPDPFDPEQETSDPDPDGPSGLVIPEVDIDGQRQIGFEANTLQYDQDSDTVTASGNVILRSGDQSLRADAVSWNRFTGEIVVEGSVRLVDENGNQLFTERVTLTDELQAGAMNNLLLAFRQGARLAAANATRAEDGDIVLDRAVYSSCPVIDSDGCERIPSWRITADRVYYDSDRERIRFTGAYLELFGARILPLPGLTVRADGGASSGFFIPDIGITASNGFELTDSYYLRLAENRDLLLSGYLYTEAAPMVSAQYRQLTERGAYQVTGYATYGSRIPLNATEPVSETDFRGYIFANGRFQLDENWSATGSVRVASDRTFLRRYDISREDRIRSVVELERIDDNSYVSIAGWATQALLVSTDQGQVPLALPLIDARYRLEEPVLGGQVEVQANTLAITRSEGQDTQRAFARAQWDMRRITPMGQEVTLTALVRGDVYHSDENFRTETPLYRGEEGWQTRGVAIAAVDVKWPFIGEAFGGTQVLTPRLQLVAAPDIRNLDIPNEDARAIDLEDSNLFSLNRFPGYDRVEDGVRLTYGADWQLTMPGWRIESTIGQSYRLDDEFNLFPDGTGLSEQFSDFVGRTQVRYNDFVKFTHRFRLDKDNFAVRRNEIDATVGTDATYAEIGYLRLNRDIDLNFEDLQDREELRAAGRVGFAQYWSIFGSAVINLTDRDEDPSFTADGFEPLRTRLGIAYADDCLEFGFTWRRDYIELADAQSGNSFRVYFALRNLGL